MKIAQFILPSLITLLMLLNSKCGSSSIHLTDKYTLVDELVDHKIIHELKLSDISGEHASEILYLNGHLLSAYDHNSVIEVWDTSKVTETYSKGQFNKTPSSYYNNVESAQGMAVNGNYLYISDNGMHIISVWTITDIKNPIYVGNIKGKDDQKMKKPHDIVIDKDLLYISDKNKNKIKVWNIQDNLNPIFETSFYVDAPEHISVFEDLLYVSSGKTIYILLKDTGDIQKEILLSNRVTGLTTDGNKLYVVEGDIGVVSLWDITYPNSPLEEDIIGSDRFGILGRIAISEKKEIYLTGIDNQTIFILGNKVKKCLNIDEQEVDLNLCL